MSHYYINLLLNAKTIFVCIVYFAIKTGVCYVSFCTCFFVYFVLFFKESKYDYLFFTAL